MLILVTGTAGLIGCLLAMRLLERGEEFGRDVLTEGEEHDLASSRRG